MFKRKAPAWLRAGRFAVGTALVVGLGSASGCLERNLGQVGPRSTAFINEKLTQSKVDKIDLVLAIDNSRSMADKQEILALAIPDLVNGLVNPGCFDINSGNVDNTPIGATTPASGKFTSIEATTGSLKLREVNFTGDTVSIADDAVATFNFGTDAGLFEVLVYNAAGSFLAQYSGIGSFTALSGLTATNKWTPSGFSSSSFAVTTGALTGTTGTDGNVTFSVGTSEVYVENRSGSTRTVSLILRGNGV